MKYLSRLTALLLALTLIFSSSVGSIAESNLSDLTRSSYDQMVSAAQEAAEAEAAAAAQEAASQPIINEGGVVYEQDIPEQTKRFDIYEVVSDAQLTMGGETEITLPQSGKINLSAGTAAQWQIYIPGADMWVNIAGETGDTFALTYAVIGGMLSGGAAKVRALAGDSAAVANISVAYGSALPPVEEEDTFVAETATASTFSLRSSDANAGIMLADTSEEGTAKEKFAVVINYVYTDGDEAASPWSASIFEGDSLTQTVTSPTIIGYKPDKETVNVEVEAISGPVTYTVTYMPAEVKYTVKHYKQNLNDDGYDKVNAEVEEKTGLTESLVGDSLAKKYDGFYSLLYDTTIAIAADGSTIVEIYYDRYYYLMTFDLDGGYGEGVEPIYARYDAEITAGTPTKAGYTFAGWKDDSTGTVYTVDNFPYKTMPAKNTSFTAQWTAGNTTYDVVFWYENANDNGYSQAGVLENQSAAAGSVVNGSSFADTNFTGRDAEHFTYSHADSNVVVKGDGSTVVNVYFSRNVYTLTFSMGSWASSCSVEEHRHSDGCYELTCTQEEHNHNGCTSTLTCTQEVHTHSSSCCTVEEHSHSLDCLFGVLCNKTEHTHGDGNCSCAKTAHSHSSKCYSYSCGKSEHTHSAVGGSCYTMTCGKYEHYHSGNTCYLIVTKKYDADITDVWTNNPVKAVIDDGNAFRSSATGDYYSFLEKMPGQNITLTASDDSGNKYTWYYYLEVLPGQDTTGLTIRTDGGKTYYEYNSASRNASSLGLTYKEDYFPITGFTQRDSTVPSFSNRVAYLYYTRNSYDLTFSNHGTTVTGKGGTYLYEADISGTYFVPDYPSTLEADAYVFEGWYTSPFFGDTKFEFTTTDADGNTVKATMPANDLTLYARWVPKEHKVNVYLTEEMNAAEKLCDEQIVAHRELATEPDEPSNGKYTFVGWFYMDGETEKAFDFSMPVTQDLNIYAKWISNTLMEYTIKYAVDNGDGTYTYIADNTTGTALAGTTKTFEAKSGKELYDLSAEGGENYQVGYYPMTNSHSIKIDIEDPSQNEYTFIYVPRTELPYKVMYLEYDGDYEYDGTEKVLLPEKTEVTRYAIASETFEPITGYMPDAYQKRLVLSADESQNVIIFWYTVDEEHAPVQIVHYIQNIEGDGYTEYSSWADLNGVIGKDYSTNVLTITGFDFDHATANGVAVDGTTGTITGTVTEDGLLLELYYNREMHPYEFQFLEQGTNEPLADPVTGIARYGAQVSENKKTISGYTCDTDVQSMIIQIEDGTTAVKNVRIFYYVEGEVTFNYIPVGPNGVNDGAGSVSLDTETVKVKTETATGSTPTAAENYKFVGWYTDEACSTPVPEGVDPTTNKLTPVKIDGLYSQEKEVYNYYAKFEYNLTTLTIKKTGLTQNSDDDRESAIFVVTDKETGKEVATIVIPANDTDGVTIDNLTVGKTYIVTEVNAWTWRYDDQSAQEITIAAPTAENVVTFNNTNPNPYWLGGDNVKTNVFGE